MNNYFSKKLFRGIVVMISIICFFGFQPGLAKAVTTVAYRTAGSNTFVVPAGVTSITVKLWGAGGTNSASYPGYGGGGGYVTGTISVTPAESLTIFVGGVGSWATGGAGYGEHAGSGGNLIDTAGTVTGKGGGSSCVVRGTTVLTVAGGGGGGGVTNSHQNYSNGGAGGGTSGETGSNSYVSLAYGGSGGTDTAGGSGGTGDINGGDGTSSSGGTGYVTGGSGGGGYYGGGGGGYKYSAGGEYGGGGGGGSSFYDTNYVTSGSTSGGSGSTPGNSGDSDRSGAGSNEFVGAVIIKYTEPDTTPPSLTSVTISSDNTDPTTARSGNVITISFTSNEPLGKATSTINGHTATVASTTDTNYTAKYTMTSGNSNGTISFRIGCRDVAGSYGELITDTTDGSRVTYTAPYRSIIKPSAFKTKIVNFLKKARLVFR